MTINENQESVIISPKILLLQPQVQDDRKIAEYVRRSIEAEFPTATLVTSEDLSNIYNPADNLTRQAVSDADLVIGNMKAAT